LLCVEEITVIGGVRPLGRHSYITGGAGTEEVAKGKWLIFGLVYLDSFQQNF
jgi:hypothetical protein